MFGGSVGSFHNDVLSANPESVEQKKQLVDELKRRAKGSLQTRNFPEAIQLYSKAIEVINEDDENGLSILYANRSMCQFSMNSFAEALSDAEESVATDPTYLKSHFRKSVALHSLKRYEEAREAILEGLSRKSDDKEMLQLLSKIDIDIANPSKVMKQATPSSASTAPAVIPKPKSALTESSPSTLSVPDTSTPMDADDPEESPDGPAIRGYKRLSNGKMTTFFNNELDEQTKVLIGDIAPKKIDAASATAATPANVVGSQWNAAGTFESKELTPWATERLTELLKDVGCVLGEGEGAGCGKVSVKTVQDLTGDAQIVVARGKRKHVCDYSGKLVLSVTLPGTSEEKEGNIQVDDITADGEYEVTVSLPVGGAVNSQGKKLLEQSVKSALQTFVRELKEK